MLQCCRCCCCCSWCVFFSPLFFSVLLCSGLLSPFKQSGKWKWKASGVCARPFFPTTIFVPRYIKATHITQWKITPTHKNNIHLANALKATTAKTKIFRSFVRLFIRTLCSPFSKCNVNGSKQRKKNHQQRREREREGKQKGKTYSRFGDTVKQKYEYFHILFKSWKYSPYFPISTICDLYEL